MSILAAVALQWLICEQADTRVTLDTDVVNLALSIERFNIQEHQPHPPGYLGYVLVLRAVHTVTGLDPVVTTKLVARLMISLSLLLLFLAVRELDPDRPASAKWALALGATSPMLLYYGVDGQTHAAEAAAAAALLWLLARGRRPTAGLPTAIAIGIVLAIGGAFRPSFAVLVIVAVPWCYWGRWRELVVIAIAGALGTAAWLVPTLQLIGGWAAFNQASDALIGMFVRKTSLLSSLADRRMVVDNLLGVALWGTIALIPVPIALLLGARAKQLRYAMVLLATMALPALVFYSLMFIAEAGYLVGLVPVVCIVFGLAIAGATQTWRRLLGGLIVFGQLVFFLVAPTTSNSALLWVPGYAEISFRQQAAEAYVRNISDGLPAEARVLVVADLGATYLYRQLPLLRPNTEVLLISSEQLAVFDQTTISLATDSSWRSAPGPSLSVEGPPSTLRTRSNYDFVVLGPRYSIALGNQIAEQAHPTCGPRHAGLGTTIYMAAAACFPSAALELGPHRLEWARKRDETIVTAQ